MTERPSPKQPEKSGFAKLVADLQKKVAQFLQGNEYQQKEEKALTGEQIAREAFLLLDAAGPEGQQPDPTFSKENTFDFTKYPSGTIIRLKFTVKRGDETLESSHLFYAIVHKQTEASDNEESKTNISLYEPIFYKAPGHVRTDNGYYFSIDDITKMEMHEVPLPNQSVVVENFGADIIGKRAAPIPDILGKIRSYEFGPLDVLQYGKREKSPKKSTSPVFSGELVPGLESN